MLEAYITLCHNIFNRLSSIALILFIYLYINMLPIYLFNTLTLLLLFK